MSKMKIEKVNDKYQNSIEITINNPLNKDDYNCFSLDLKNGKVWFSDHYLTPVTFTYKDLLKVVEIFKQFVKDNKNDTSCQ